MEPLILGNPHIAVKLVLRAGGEEIFLGGWVQKITASELKPSPT